MPVLERSESSNCANPELDVFLRIGGILTDPYSLEFIIYELVTAPGTPTQTYPPSGRATVDLSDCPTGHKLSLGRYVAEWDVPADQVVGDHLIRWWFRESAGATEKQWDQEFNVVLPGAATSTDGYCSVQDVRDEGFADPPYSDDRIIKCINRTARMLERFTGRWFGPRTREFRLKAKGRQRLECPAPIIQINEVAQVDVLGDDYSETEITLDDLIVYNRHLTMGLTDPDDRDDPAISWRKDTRLWRGESVGERVESWPEGFQIIVVRGVFGYTELAAGATPGESATGSQVPLSQGIVPLEIVEANLRMAIRELPLRGDTDAVEDARDRWRITMEKTREQSYSRTSLSAAGMVGAWTGDPEIDELIAPFVAPPGMGMI